MYEDIQSDFLLDFDHLFNLFLNKLFVFVLRNFTLITPIPSLTDLLCLRETADCCSREQRQIAFSNLSLLANRILRFPLEQSRCNMFISFLHLGIIRQ